MNLSQVSPESRRKVLDAIKKLDFKPNELARSLVMRKSNMIGVIAKDIEFLIWHKLFVELKKSKNGTMIFCFEVLMEILIWT